ncbi:MAG: hypothetical protein K0U93_13045 [Gammaproteobacteria bacterium]|nr:hypothetical protein [Gammaproteobacteria bacterium]
MRKFQSVLATLMLGACGTLSAGDLLVIEGADVTHDVAAGVVYAKQCPDCEALRLNVDKNTVVLVNGKKYPLAAGTKLSPADTAYDSDTKTVTYFRPLVISSD